jgi:hypothetical protein
VPGKARECIRWWLLNSLSALVLTMAALFEFAEGQWMFGLCLLAAVGMLVLSIGRLRLAYRQGYYVGRIVVIQALDAAESLDEFYRLMSAGAVASEPWEGPRVVSPNHPSTGGPRHS